MTYSGPANEVLKLVKASGIEWTPEAQKCEQLPVGGFVRDKQLRSLPRSSCLGYGCSLRRGLHSALPAGKEWGCNVSVAASGNACRPIALCAERLRNFVAVPCPLLFSNVFCDCRKAANMLQETIKWRKQSRIGGYLKQPPTPCCASLTTNVLAAATIWAELLPAVTSAHCAHV